MDSLLQTMTGPWTSYILWLLSSQGTLRFGELKAKMPGISSKVLTERLRMLEGSSLVNRDYKPTIPPSVSYSLTPRGTELRDVLDGLNVLALRWHEEDMRVKA
jgi:DNA-binding HxlR family transcriptional regulator